VHVSATAVHVSATAVHVSATAVHVSATAVLPLSPETNKVVSFLNGETDGDDAGALVRASAHKMIRSYNQNKISPDRQMRAVCLVLLLIKTHKEEVGKTYSAALKEAQERLRELGYSDDEIDSLFYEREFVTLREEIERITGEPFSSQAAAELIAKWKEYFSWEHDDDYLYFFLHEALSFLNNKGKLTSLGITMTIGAFAALASELVYVWYLYEKEMKAAIERLTSKDEKK